MPPHRKQNQHFNEPGQLHFMTFSCYRRLQLLTNDLYRTWLARALDKALAAHDFQLSGFVFMPELVELESLESSGTSSRARFAEGDAIEILNCAAEPHW